MSFTAPNLKPEKITIVLLPGMDGTGLLFESFVAALSPEFDTIVVRYPGDEPLGYPALETIARAAMPDDGRPFILLGESFSGPIAISLAASAPPGLKALILCCSFAGNPRPLLGKLRFVRGLPFWRAPVKLSSWLLMGRHANDDMRSAFGRAMSLVSARALRARVAAVLAVDVSAKLEGLRLPILYLRAMEDRVVPASAAESIKKCAANASIVDLAAPHFLLQAMPGEAAREVRRFIGDEVSS